MLVEADVVLLGGYDGRDTRLVSGVTVHMKGVGDVEGCCFRASKVQQPRGCCNEGRCHLELYAKVNDSMLKRDRIPIWWVKAVRSCSNMWHWTRHGKFEVAVRYVINRIPNR